MKSSALGSMVVMVLGLLLVVIVLMIVLYPVLLIFAPIAVIKFLLYPFWLIIEKLTIIIIGLTGLNPWVARAIAIAVYSSFTIFFIGFIGNFLSGYKYLFKADRRKWLVLAACTVCLLMYFVTQNLYFSPITGEPLKKYYIDQSGRIELFPLEMNFHPQYGEPLKLITKDIVVKLIAAQSRPAPPLPPGAGNRASLGNSNRQSAPARPPAPASPSYSIREIVPVAWSYSSGIFAGGAAFGPALPYVDLKFWSGLIADGDVQWHAGYTILPHRLDLRVEKPRTFVFASANPFTDFAAGYAVTLDGAMFEDYTMARTVLILRSFQGDTPPPAEKSFAVVPIPREATSSIDLTGAWAGFYQGLEYNGGEISLTSIVLRLRQTGNHLVGQSIEEGSVQGREEKFRFEIEGWVIGEKVTMIKKRWDPRWNQACGHYDSWVLTFDPGANRISGTWYSGLAKGTLALRRVGPLVGDISDFSSVDATNPPPGK